MSHNAKLKEALSSLSKRIDRAEKESDLIDAILSLKQFQGPIKYDNAIPYNIAIASAAGLVVSGYYFFFSNIPFMGDFGIPVMITFAVISIASIVFACEKDHSIAELSDYIFKRDAIFDNALNPICIEGNPKGEQLAEKLIQDFCEFDRGNYSREFTELYEGSAVVNNREVSYYFYNFEYVDRRVETTVTSNGKGGTTVSTRTVYDEYYRSGLIIPFPFARKMAILGKSTSGISGFQFRPASLKFNQVFTAYGGSELAISKFLKPTVVLALEAMDEAFDEVNVEINGDSMLCFSFNDDNLIDEKRCYGLGDPDNFVAEIQQKRPLLKLHAVLDHIRTLYKYSDNNFTE